MNRSRAAGGLITAVAVSGMLVALPATSSFAAAKNCPTALPTAQVVDGLKGTGYTVERGTQAEEFTAEVLGRVTDGIAPGVDMIMAEVDSPALERAGGVWAGMSGSPVYTSDGKLIGSVSYGLAASSKIAGITPAADLLALRGGTAGTPKVAVSSARAARIARTGEVSVKVAARGFERLPVPVTVTGAAQKNGGRFLSEITKASGATVHRSTARISARAKSTPGEIFAGSNYAAALSYGDVSAVGLGTTTYVCGTTAVAFGHPFNNVGKAEYSVHPATAVYVQADPNDGPFKVGNPGGVVGTVTHDGTIGLRSTLGTTPRHTYPITTSLKKGSKTFTGKTVGVYQPVAGDVAATHLMGAIIKANGAQSGGTASLTYTITGTRDGGKKFSLSRSETYADATDIGFAAADSLYGTLVPLVEQEYETVDITGITIRGTVTSTYKPYRVTKVETRKSGRWVALKGTQKVRSGAKLPLRATLSVYRDSSKKVTVPLTVAVPKKSKGWSGSLSVGDASSVLPGAKEPNSLTSLLAQLRSTPPNDTLVSRIDVSSSKGATRSSTTRVRLNSSVNGYQKVVSVKIS
ncbi:SpoIVB peptidase S55 domain-containing protein [Kineosporia succinea]|uniref:Peptidase S55 domain-containing protein n=1 Tax=Kineosporia succinea TaxID=84632 RepID=A0ABT9PDK0_9ACTN|nr:SpoIVB peptidase S55 domain-containing protein [Kineosporia succinea]MDP9830772.1 hypothetical protein [Kineosporia succinea]